MRYCPWCGAQLQYSSAAFCEHCGKKLTLEEESMPPAAWQPEQPPRQEQADEPQTAPESTPDDREPFFDVEFSEVHGEPVYEVPSEQERSSRKKRAILLAVVAVLLLALVGVGMVAVTLRTSPDRAAAELVDAIRQEDVLYIERHMQVQNGLSWGSDGSDRLCESLRSEKALTRLQAHLATLGDTGKEGYNPDYDCFRMVRRPGLRFSDFYRVEVYPITVEIASGLDTLTMEVDGQPQQETPVSKDGVARLNLLPGQHHLSASYTVGEKAYPLGETEIYSFSATVPVSVSQLGGNGISVQIELAGVEQDLKVAIDGSSTGLEPKEGKVTVSPAFEGMTITLSCDAYTQDFTVGNAPEQRFEVALIGQMEQANPNGARHAPEEMTNRQLSAYLAQQFYTFYTSYLEAINVWDAGLITGVEQQARDTFVQKMEAHNKNYLFKFKWAEVDRCSLVRGEESGRPVVDLWVQTDYDYSFKDNQSMWYAGGNYQKVRMAYDEGTDRWSVLSTTVTDYLPMSDDVIRLP